MTKQRKGNQDNTKPTINLSSESVESASAPVKEDKFYRSLRDVFVGAKVEGESGYINLMAIKSRYYENGVFPKLKQDIDKALEAFPNFREELFDKLYDFFHRYFSESGSIYFRYTPLHQNVYEKVYTDDKDVMLFWKTHMLYYVKTDRLFRPLEAELDGFKFFFDVSTLEHKRANEKRETIYEFKTKRDDSTLVFNVSYSERGRQTKVDEILRELRGQGVSVSEEVLERAFRVFERQSEVDYFINKNAKAFLQEQFNLWLYQYVFSGESEWTETRIKQLQALKDIAFKIIDFISQFEDELVKIWNKPKFVLNSNYVITLDRIFERDTDLELWEKLLKHENFEQQVEEWKQLGIVDSNFRKIDVALKEEYRHLPIDTKYFKDLELEILELFDGLDQALDGWLIKSENYQTLNTILLKFREKAQTIYIDPPFNTGTDFDYVDRFQDSTWLSLMGNRIEIAKALLNTEGSIYVHLDFNADYLGRHLLNSILGGDNFRNEIVWYYTNKIPDTRKRLFTNSCDFLLFYARAERNFFEYLTGKRDKPIKVSKMKKVEGKKIYERDETGKVIMIERTERVMDNVWNIPLLHAQNEIFDFKTQKPEELLRRVILSTSKKGQLVMDFFLGIGTTTAVAHKLKRKWVGVEMGEHFWKFYQDDEGERKTGALGRMKEVLAGKGVHEPCGISEEVGWKGGGFFKYYELEQYEDVLRKAKYEDSDLFEDPYRDPYNQYVFLRDLKMLHALDVDLEQNKVEVDLSKLYPNIDIAETLSNLRGKWIKKITSDFVEFEDGEKVNTKDLDYRLIKPLIWW